MHAVFSAECMHLRVYPRLRLWRVPISLRQRGVAIGSKVAMWWQYGKHSGKTANIYRGSWADWSLKKQALRQFVVQLISTTQHSAISLSDNVLRLENWKGRISHSRICSSDDCSLRSPACANDLCITFSAQRRNRSIGVGRPRV